MRETCENWLGLVKSCDYYAHATHKIHQVLPYLVDFKAPRDYRVRQYLENDLFRIIDL